MVVVQQPPMVVTLQLLHLIPMLPGLPAQLVVTCISYCLYGCGHFHRTNPVIKQTHYFHLYLLKPRECDVRKEIREAITHSCEMLDPKIFDN